MEGKKVAEWQILAMRIGTPCRAMPMLLYFYCRFSCEMRFPIFFLLLPGSLLRYIGGELHACTARWEKLSHSKFLLSPNAQCGKMHEKVAFVCMHLMIWRARCISDAFCPFCPRVPRAPLLYLFAPWGKSPKKKWSSGHEWKGPSKSIGKFYYPAFTVSTFPCIDSKLKAA